MGGGATWSNLLKNGTALDEGNYMLVTGTRLANGGVLSDITFFTIKPGETTTVDLVMRESKDDVQVIGNFNSESLYKPIDSDELKSILSTTGRGYYIVAVLGAGQEVLYYYSPMKSSSRSSGLKNFRDCPLLLHMV